MSAFTINKSFAISAGAGSGKTYTLSRRYINAFLGFDFFGEEIAKFEKKEDKKAEIDKIVTITYTKAAANEMKSRIFELMKKIINEDNEVQNELNKISNEQKKICERKTKIWAYKN